MNEGYTGKPIHYCYNCGTRLRPTIESCWYCGVPVRREIRPPRRCPFCAEPIRPESIKCRHCGEFVDGRQRAEPRPVNQLIVIDRSLLKTMADLQLVPGAPVPEAARAILDERTVRAIGENVPEEIRQPGVKVLPAPPAASLPMIEYEPRRQGSSEIVHVPKSGPPARRETAAEPPVARTPGPPALRSEGATEPPAFRRTAAQGPLPPAGGPRDSGPDSNDVVDAEVADLYRLCDVCHTENLASDNFCYYCGKKHRRTHIDDRRDAVARRRTFFKALKVLALLILLGTAAAGIYLYKTGRLSRDKLKDLEQTVRRTVQEKVGQSLGELAAISPGEVWNAEQCRKNLRALAEAKRDAAGRLALTGGQVPLDDVLKQLGATKLPACPSSGTYSLNPIGQPPTCSIGDNGTTSTLDDHIIRDEPPKNSSAASGALDKVENTTNDGR